MNTFLQKIKDDKLRICQCEWCKDCPLSLAGYPNRKNIFTDISKELRLNKETRYRMLPDTFCAKEMLMHTNPNPEKWVKELDGLIEEVSDMSFDESYDFILNKFPTEIVELKQLMKNRVKAYKKYQRTKVKCCNYGCK